MRNIEQSGVSLAGSVCRRNEMQPTLHEIDAAINEAQGVRARHDGVHAIHGCLAVLFLCRDLAESGKWPDAAEKSYRATMIKVRCIDRTGFPPHLDSQIEWISRLRNSAAPVLV
jgi:hypothetical protein